MLRYVSVAALLIVTCSAYARKGFPAATSNRGNDVKFTTSNSTFLSIAQELGIMEGKMYVDIQPLISNIAFCALNVNS